MKKEKNNQTLYAKNYICYKLYLNKIAQWKMYTKSCWCQTVNKYFFNFIFILYFTFDIFLWELSVGFLHCALFMEQFSNRICAAHFTLCNFHCPFFTGQGTLMGTFAQKKYKHKNIETSSYYKIMGIIWNSSIRFS